MALHRIECPVCGRDMDIGDREFAAQARREPIPACSIECDRRARRIVRDMARVQALKRTNSDRPRGME